MIGEFPTSLNAKWLKSFVPETNQLKLLCLYCDKPVGAVLINNRKEFDNFLRIISECRNVIDMETILSLGFLVEEKESEVSEQIQPLECETQELEEDYSQPETLEEEAKGSSEDVSS